MLGVSLLSSYGLVQVGGCCVRPTFEFCGFWSSWSDSSAVKNFQRCLILSALGLGCIVLFLHFGAAYSESGSEAVARSAPVLSTCRIAKAPLWRLNTKGAVERYIVGEIRSSFELNGFVDWACIIHNFESSGDNTRVRTIPDHGSDFSKFIVEKPFGWSSGFGLFYAPGASNGIYTATVLRSGDGGIALSKRGSNLKWLKLE